MRTRRYPGLAAIAKNSAGEGVVHSGALPEPPVLWMSLALAAPPPVRLLVVGDTGWDSEAARLVSARLATELAEPGPETWIVALGDLYYDRVPLGPACVDEVTARYRAFFGAFPAGRVRAVLGNHDVAGPDGKWSAEAKACSEGAFRKMEWLGEGPLTSRVERLDGPGVKIDLALVEAGVLGTGEEAPTALPLRAEADWRFYASHYTWRTVTGKCKEADEIPVRWLGSPPMDLWLNGHAHHLDAVQVDRVMTLTSGAGHEMRAMDHCGSVRGEFTYVAEGERKRGGYLRLDVLSSTQLRVTPVVCDVGTACVDMPALTCTRRTDGRGVSCSTP